MGVMESMKRGYKSIMADPGKHAKNIKDNATSQAGKTKTAVKKAGEKAGMAATRGTGLGPARGLRDVLMEAKRKVMGE